MAWKLIAAPYCLLFLLLALALHNKTAAQPLRSMFDLDLDEESTLAKLRFEAGNPACGRFQFRDKCFNDVSPSSQTTSAQEPAQVLPEADYPQNNSDCGPLGRHKYRCVPPKDTTVKTPAPEEVSAVKQDAHVLPEAPSDCGPLGKYKYRCAVPPMKTPIDLKTPAPAPGEVSRRVDPSVQEAHQPARSACGPLSNHKYRCVPPMHYLARGN